MQKFFKRFTAVLFLISALLFGAVLYGNLTIPDTIPVLTGGTVHMPSLFSVTASASADSETVRFLETVAVKKSRVEQTERSYAVPLGSAFGIKLYTDGVMIVRADAVPTANGSVSPAQRAGIRAGDMILTVDGKPVHTNASVAALFTESAGQPLRLHMKRETAEFDTILTAVRSAADGKYRAGIWVRDSSAGIGTLTFYVPQSGLFAGLGHAVCDADTGKVLPLSDGEAMDAFIRGSYKGRVGDPGELCGVFGRESIGTLLLNTESGIYGSSAKLPAERDAVPVAMYYEVQEGPATILAEIDESGTREFSVEITKLFSNPDAHQKNLVVKVTDPELIASTGGIVQGMSGSPILQNGMLVGAVTHVFINDPLQGFGIYAQTMLDEIHKLSNIKEAA